MQRPSRRAAARSFTLEMATVDNATATFDDATATVDNATATRGNATATFGNAMATRGNATATRDNTRATLGSAVGVVSAEDEPTVTAFGASDDGAFGPTRAFGRRSVPPLLLAQGRHGSRNARVAVFTLATAITLLAGIVCSPDRVEGAPAVAIASLAPASEPAPQPSPPTAAAPTVAGASLAPASEAAPQPSPSIVTAPVVAVTPVETPLAPAVTEGKTSPTPAVARRPPKPRVAPRAAPCVAKVDPVSGKTIYLGSCD